MTNIHNLPLNLNLRWDSSVDIYKVEEDLSVREIIEKYCKSQLEQITTPTHSVEESQVGR